jgi:hypothetical protein
LRVAFGWKKAAEYHPFGTDFSGSIVVVIVPLGAACITHAAIARIGSARICKRPRDGYRAASVRPEGHHFIVGQVKCRRVVFRDVDAPYRLRFLGSSGGSQRG